MGEHLVDNRKPPGRYGRVLPVSDGIIIIVLAIVIFIVWLILR